MKLKEQPVTAINLSKQAIRTIDICRLPGENDREVIDRLLVMLLPIASDIDVFFGKQGK